MLSRRSTSPPRRRAARLRTLLALAVVAAALGAAARPAAAQSPDRPLDPAARRTLRPAAARVAEIAPAAPPTVRRGPTRADATGRVRADYRLDASPVAGASPEATARAFLAAHAARYGLGPDAGATLGLDTVVAAPSGATVRFVQRARLATGEALPVVGRGVSVTMDGAGRVLMATSNVAAVGAVVPPFGISADEAAARVGADVLAVPAVVRVVRRAAFVGSGREGVDAAVRPAYVVRATPTATGGVPVAWEAIVDGETGALLLLTERVAGHRRGGSALGALVEVAPVAGPRRDAVGAGFGPANPLTPPVAEARAVSRSKGVDARAPALRRSAARPGAIATPSATAYADGSGLAFVPDPLTSAGAAYGVGGFVDGGDADTPDLSAQRREVALPGIALAGGRYTLVGPYVEVTGEAIGGGTASVVPSEASPSGFRYPRSDPRFEAVMAYHHIDASQRYVQRLALGRPVRERPIRVSPRGISSDDSYFAFDQNALVFGTGGIDDAEDADVIWHEYGHVLLHDQTPGLFENFEARALHEGWSDFWAASYSHRLVTEGRVPDHDWRRIYSWDGNNGCWQGRRLDHAGVYSPTDRSRMGYPARPGCAAPSTLYQWGLLWATTLADIQADIGIEASNRIVVASLAMLGGAAGPFPAAPPMEVAAEALLAADRALYGGAHEAALVARLSARGFVDAGRFGPVVRHTPLASSEQSGGTRRVEVEAAGASSPVAAVRVVWRVDGGAAQTLALAEVAPARYAGDLPLPSGPSTVAYVVEATDAAGRTTRLPAADSVFAFATGPDRTAPALAHAPRPTAPRGAFPLRLVATATDALGIDTVTVAYALERGGASIRQGVAGLARVAGTEATFVGTIPLGSSDVQVGDAVVYTITARDRASARNEATAGPVRVAVVAEGVVASFGAEADEGVAMGGAWRRGAPVRGLVRARAGQGVYSTGLDAPYPATRGTSVLALPPLDLSLGGATLAFSQWHDLERGGGCGSACDGGQVQVSTDDGQTWRRLALAATAATLPVPGADTLAVLPSTGALLDGPRVVGGASLGWQRATAALPGGASVRVRFVLATDGGNVYPTPDAFAGWALDSITVSTTAAALPPVPALADAAVPETVTPGAAVPVAIAITTPDGALATATAVLRRAGSVVRRDSVRLAQDARDLRRFAGAVAMNGALAGDTLALTLRVRDSAGRDVSHRATVLVRTVATADALASVTASGLWRLRDGLWAASDGGDTASPPPPTSSLVLAPREIPVGAERVRLVLRHRVVLGAGAGGTVEVSSDDGRSWAPILPARGYPATLVAPGHPLDGAAVFAGRDTSAAVFDLSAFRGQTVRLRLRLATTGRLAFGDLWEVTSARVEAQSASALPTAPGAFAVSQPFPNPFRERLSVAVTLAEPSPLDAVLVDALGRRVAVLAGGDVREAGTHVLRADAPGLAAGVYVLVVRAGRERWTGTVVAVR